MATKETIKTPSRAQLLDLLSYDPETGVLIWKERHWTTFNGRNEKDTRRIATTWNCRYAGKQALQHLRKDGYFSGAVKGVGLLAHRVIWKIITGEDSVEVDHINGVRSDNRACNLRNVSRETNMKNKGMRKDNSSGATGVSLRGKRWRARIRIRGRGVILGTFNTYEEAVNARIEAEKDYGFTADHGKAIRPKTLAKEFREVAA